MFCLAPAILFSCLSSVYRGYYEGMSNMYPTAISEVMEAIFKLLVGLSAAYLVFRLGMGEFYSSGTVWGQQVTSEAFAKSALLPYTAAAAVFGVTIGSFASFFYLWIRHKRKGDSITCSELQCSPPCTDRKSIVGRLIKMGNSHWNWSAGCKCCCIGGYNISSDENQSYYVSPSGTASYDVSRYDTGFRG